MVHSPFAAAFTPGTRLREDRGRTIVMSTRALADLQVPSGRITVADPFETSFDEPGTPLARTAPTGTFPVEVALAHLDNGDIRVACARVRFGEGPAVSWEAATFEGQAPIEDKIPGYGVDAGTGCFFDVAACAPVSEAETEAWLAATQANYVGTATWHVAPVGGANVVMFSSGWGDGFYGSFWGFDAKGGLAELVTDFEVLLGSIYEQVALPLPLPRGRLSHPDLARHAVSLRTLWLSRNMAILGGRGAARVELSSGGEVQMSRKGGERHYTWTPPPPGTQLLVMIHVGVKPLDVLEAA